MADAVEMIALNEIWRGGRMVATDRTDAEGVPILRREPEIVRTGERFSCPPGEVADLIGTGAAVRSEGVEP